MAHCCEGKKCIGQKYNGLFFKCSKCGSKSFFDCVMAREEVSSFLISIDMITIKQDKLTMNSLKETVAKRTFESILHDQSVIQFVCVKCLDGDRVIHY